jgi:hypothetical protein
VLREVGYFERDDLRVGDLALRPRVLDPFYDDGDQLLVMIIHAELSEDVRRIPLGRRKQFTGTVKRTQTPDDVVNLNSKRYDPRMYAPRPTIRVG